MPLPKPKVSLQREVVHTICGGVIREQKIAIGGHVPAPALRLAAETAIATASILTETNGVTMPDATRETTVIGLAHLLHDQQALSHHRATLGKDHRSTTPLKSSPWTRPLSVLSLADRARICDESRPRQRPGFNLLPARMEQAHNGSAA